MALCLLGCGGAGLNRSDGPFAPGVAGMSQLDGLVVGHRLMAGGEYELALKAYHRAAAQQGLNVDTMSAIGSANLNLGRLGQAETWLRRAVEEDPTFPPAWNNLGVVLMEKGQMAEASEVFRRAFAADNGNSDEIRENLRLSLASLNDSGDDIPRENQTFHLIRRGAGDFALTSDL
nr:MULTISPECIES: tetratricopeptide repeat protein [unclassified Yoonia]